MDNKDDIEQELSELRKFRFHPEDKTKFLNILEKKSKEQLFDMTDNILRDNIFSYKPVIEFIVEKLYSDDDRFIALLCSLIEKVSSDMACGNIIVPIEKLALKDPKITIAISEKMLTKGVRSGIYSGFMISPLLGKEIVDKEIMDSIGSDNPLLKRRALVALCNSFIRGDEKVAKLFIPKLVEIAKDIDREDSNIIIHTLVMAYYMNKDSVLPVLSDEIDRRGYIAAIAYVRASLYNPETPIHLLEKAVSIIESETQDYQMIDEILGIIYEKNQEFVVKRLRTRLNETGFPITHNTMLDHYISQNPNPVAKMMEEEIDNRNQTMLEVGDSLLESVFSSLDKCFEWCKKWKDDIRKEKVVIKLLAKILTDKRDHESSVIVDESIQILKKYAEMKKINFEKETKHIHLKEEEKYKEEILKTLHIVGLILHPPSKIEVKILERVLLKFPYVCRAIDADWLLHNATTDSPHILAYVYGWELNQSEIDKMVERFETEKDVWTKAVIGMFINSDIHRFQEQDYWEQVFKTLYDHKIPIKKQELKNNQLNYLSEAEVTARLAHRFEVKIKPDIPEFETLDIQIEHNGQKALIEIKTVESQIEHRVAGMHGVISSFPGGKVKHVLLTKFNEQLKGGKVDPKIPILLILNVTDIMGGPFYEVENALYGQFQFSYTMETTKHITVKEGSTRALENAFYGVEGVDIVTTVGAYTRDITNPSPLTGKLYKPFHSSLPKNPMSREFRIRLRDALFDDSETSSWQGLMQIEGIDEKIARIFYKNGIEDLNTLATAEDRDLEIEGMSKETGIEYQKEAKRVLAAIQTDSIRYLKGMNQKYYDILTQKEIHLIKQILKITETPEGVDSDIWEDMIEDAKRIKGTDKI